MVKRKGSFTDISDSAELRNSIARKTKSFLRAICIRLVGMSMPDALRVIPGNFGKVHDISFRL